MDPNTIIGPMISRAHQEKVNSYIELGRQEGAELVFGGGTPVVDARFKNGYWVQPTVFANVDNKMRIAQEEIFGPVLVVIPFDDDDDAVRIANESAYGLSGGVRSASPERAMKLARRIRSGSISVNGGMCIAGDIPFGGYKASGIGREWGVEGIEEFLETKLIAARI
jgi:aldehyde dehydrogenase (NAD+)